MDSLRQAGPQRLRSGFRCALAEGKRSGQHRVAGLGLRVKD